MSYMFPFTRNQDSDLRRIIELYLTVRHLPEDWEAYKLLMDTNFQELKDFVNNYFEGLDIQAEIDQKLQEMIADGTLAEIINQEIFGEIQADIAELTTNVSNNTTNIATNAQDIAGVREDVTVNTQAIENLYITVGLKLMADFNPTRDGRLHPLSERYDTIDAAKADYPPVTSLDQSIDWAALQSYIDYCQTNNVNAFIGEGRYYITQSLTMDNSVNPISFMGSGPGKTQISGDDFNVLTVNGNATPVKYRTYSTYSGFTVSNRGTTSAEACGIEFIQCAYIKLSNIYANGFMYGVRFRGVEHSRIEFCQAEACYYGFRAPDVNLGTYTAFNDNAFINCRMTGNTIGCQIQLGSGNVFISNSVENNSTAGLSFENIGYQGNISATILGNYFENNQRVGSIYVNSPTTTGVTNVIGNIFNFVVGENYPGVNINDTDERINVIGNAFTKYENYTEGAYQYITFQSPNLIVMGNTSNFDTQVTEQINIIGNTRYVSGALQYFNGSEWITVIGQTRYSNSTLQYWNGTAWTNIV